MVNRFKNLALAVGMLALPASLTAVVPDEKPSNALEQKVRKELVMLPYYNVFDNLAFRLEGGKVILLGQVSRPTLKSDAANVVKRIPGVTEVVNQIEVLPLSSFDDRVRLGVLRSIYGSTALSRYGLGTQPSIRIIVKNGEVTLEGVVASEMDRNLAYLKANGVFGVFSVTNHLRVENRQG